jgi:Methyltransferase domain
MSGYPSKSIIGLTKCSVCSNEMETMLGDDQCPHCKSPARTRSLGPIMRESIEPRLSGALASTKPLLAFAMTGAEKSILSKSFPKFVSASLYGEYGEGHISGVDVRDLSRFGEAEFSGIFSILLFDYVPELDKAFAECFRVLDKDGLFFTQIAPYRLVDGDTEVTAKEIAKRPGYFDYIPGNNTLPSISVGRDRVMKCLEGAGFFAEHVAVTCPLSNQRSDWFIAARRPFDELRRDQQISAGPAVTAAALGDDAAIGKLAEELWNDTTDKDAKAKSVKLFMELAQRGISPNASYRLGCAYRYGYGVAKNNARALDYLSDPALDNWRSASYIKGVILVDKSYEGFDLDAGLVHLRKAHEQGIAEAGQLIDRLEAGARLTPEYIEKAPRSGNSLASGVLAPRYDGSCTICGFSLQGLPSSLENCPACAATPRTRAFPLFMTSSLRPLISSLKLPELPLLAFAATDVELAILAGDFPKIESVSLYGNYSNNHTIGVDARDLSRYPDNSFAGSFGILVFDFFVEQEKALSEAARVIKDGGVFFHQIGSYRLQEGSQPARIENVIHKRDDYYQYLPDDHGLVSISMGIDWYVSELEKAGFEAQHINVLDPHSGQDNHWFVGVRRPR